jgi:predicted Fe-Mo cluster-binding NifX family protein
LEKLSKNGMHRDIHISIATSRGDGSESKKILITTEIKTKVCKKIGKKKFKYFGWELIFAFQQQGGEGKCDCNDTI